MSNVPSGVPPDPVHDTVEDPVRLAQLARKAAAKAGHRWAIAITHQARIAPGPLVAVTSGGEVLLLTTTLVLGLDSAGPGRLNGRALAHVIGDVQPDGQPVGAVELWVSPPRIPGLSRAMMRVILAAHQPGVTLLSWAQRPPGWPL